MILKTISKKKLNILSPDSFFNCVQCGECCKSYSIPLTKDEIKKIKSHKYKDFFTMLIIDGDIIPTLKKRIWDNGCIFQDPETNFCMIHKYRPAACKLFPFFFVKKDEIETSNENTVDFDYRGILYTTYVIKECKGFIKGKTNNALEFFKIKRQLLNKKN